MLKYAKGAGWMALRAEGRKALVVVSDELRLLVDRPV